MRILLDESECDLQVDSIGEAIAAAAELAREDGRMVVEVVVDGRTWTASDLDSPELTTESADEVHLTTADPRQLVTSALADAVEALGRVLALQSDAAELLQGGNQATALQRLGEAVGLWLTVQQAIVQCSEIAGVNLDECSAAGRSAIELVEELGRHLGTLRDQLQAGDVSAVADTLLYDLPDVVEQWRELLAEMQRKVEEA
jgi:hypothetical protein